MNIVFCYYENIEFDARAQDTLECTSMMGNVFFVSFSESNLKRNNIENVTIKKRDYFDFLCTCKKTIKSKNPQIVFLHDNYCARLIPYIKKNNSNCIIIYDMSEIYIGEHKKDKYGFVSKYLLEYAEYKYLRNADIVLAACEERAYIAKGYYGLHELPIVFDNIHRIDETYVATELDRKYGLLFSNETFKTIYAGGLSSGDRDVAGLIKAHERLGTDYELFIAGINKEDPAILALVEKNKKNVHYLGKLKRSELKYIYDHCDLNVSLFDLNSVNTIFCASGKIYEGLFEGLPVLLSPNPPHVRIVRDYGIGRIAYQGDYATEIIKIKKDYNIYAENVKSFVEQINYEDRIDLLKNRIVDEIKKREKLRNA